MSHSHDHSGHDHSHGHSHSHGHASHGHAHSHAPADFGTAFAIGIALNTLFVVIEATFGFLSNSLALVADAGHNLSDVLGLLIAWGANVLSRRPSSTRYTYGLRGSSILAALLNAIFLLVATGAMIWEAVLRLFNPAAVAGPTVMLVAAIGIAINGFTAWLFASGRKDDLNIRGAYLHMAADAAVSAGVVVAGLIIYLTGWLRLDSLVTLIIAAVIIVSTWGLLRESIAMSLAAVPVGIESEKVRQALAAAPGVTDVHHLHIWSLSTSEVALTVHLVMPDGHPGDRFLLDLSEQLKAHHGIGHATLQIETGSESACALVPDDHAH
jgi:cobalt-zinc-cadmium efflux system protein